MSTGYVQVMGQYDRIITQLKEAESDIYETMNLDFGIERARRHTSAEEKSGFEGIFSIKGS